MSYSRESLAAAKEAIAANHSRAEGRYEENVRYAKKNIPEIKPLLDDLAACGSELAELALSHTFTKEKLTEIRQRNAATREKIKELLAKNGLPDDYLTLKYSCSKCSDSGYVGIKMCDCLKREIAKKEFENSGIAPLAVKQSFGNFSFGYYTGEDRVRIEQNYEMLKEFAEDFADRKGESWLLIGPTGLGKTHLSTSVAKTVLDSGFSVVYDTITNILADFEKKRFEDNSYKGDRKYLECDLLIIDDLGVEIPNQFVLSCLYNLVNSRIVNNQSTIINTNLSQSEMNERYTDRITSRLLGEYMPLLFSGSDIRYQKLVSD